MVTLRILVVEDDGVDRLALRRAIGQRADVDDAANGGEALELLSKKRYDLALVDYFLPPGTGLHVLSQLRARQPDLPVIFLSGHGNEEVVVEAMKAGASDYITKAAVEERDRLWRVVVAAVETHRLRREAEGSRARLALAVEAAGAGTWELDLAWRAFRGDERFRALLGLSDEPTWSADTVRSRLAPESAARLEEQLKAGRVSAQLELVDGNDRWIELRGRLEGRGPGARIFGTAVDISTVKQEEARAAALRERLMGIASHDLKNPLSAVLQASALLAQSPRLEAREKRYVQHIRSSAERMTHLIVQLLDLTRVRLGGGLPLDRRSTRLDEAVRQVASELELSAPERRISLQLDAVQIDADPDRLAQLASNLLGNAVKHSPPDTPVVVRVSRNGTGAVLSVRNGGRPIPIEQQALIFEPFVQYGDHAARDGLGLGLYISREIARAHGGALTVQSDAEGTCFTATLPA